METLIIYVFWFVVYNTTNKSWLCDRIHFPGFPVWTSMETIPQNAVVWQPLNGPAGLGFLLQPDPENYGRAGGAA